MIKEVIVTAEGSEQDLAIIPLAASIAGQLQVPQSLVSVAPERAAIDARREQLAERLGALGAGDARIEVWADSNVADSLATAIARHPEALVCLRTHARTPIGELALGSVAEEIVRRSGVPAVLAGPRWSSEGRDGIKSLLLCLDTSPLSESMLPTAIELARRCAAELRLLEVLAPERSSIRSASDVAGESSYLHQVAQRIRDEQGLEASWDVLYGEDPGQAVAEYAGGIPGAVIAMTTHGRSGLSQVVMGSVSNRTLRRATCPVLLYRPK